MQNKKKKEKRIVFYKKITLFLVIVFFAWFNLSRADLNGLNIFQDRDQDGLSDQEELAYGTNPDKADTDEDGYSDKIEIESGYDPLKAAPGDRIVLEKEVQTLGVNEKKEGNNITNEFFNEIKNQKTGEAAILNELLTTGDVTEEELDSLYSSSGKGGINDILHGLVDNNLKEGEEKEVVVSVDDIKIIPKPEGDEEEVKNEEKEQIERYMSSLLYIISINRPFELEADNTEDLSNKVMDFIYQVDDDIQSGNVEEVQNYKKTFIEIFNQIKKLETPYVLIESHLSLLSVYQNFINEIDEVEILNDDDPITLLFYISKIENFLIEANGVQQEFDKIFKEYEITSIDPSLVNKGY
ncbi:MAG: hypothetical protein PF549_00760 [Patescibacteria group bacterium]|jgi:hypothetical protein|nr:hypothetical protein [Patescibacteria group bacterium]